MDTFKYRAEGRQTRGRVKAPFQIRLNLHICRPPLAEFEARTDLKGESNFAADPVRTFMDRRMANWATACGQTLLRISRRPVTQSWTCARRSALSRGVSSDSRAVPRIAQASVWNSIIPRALRHRQDTASEPKHKRAHNPANYFIWIYILIGSQAIRILQLQNEFNTFMRRAELKIGKLREVIEALKRGEEIDVERTLGTGDETQEREWEEALKEIENEDQIWQTNRQRKREAKERARQEAADEASEDTASPVNTDADQRAKSEDEGSSGQEGRPKAPGFY
jgi:Family of unknown function (DUF5321)